MNTLDKDLIGYLRGIHLLVLLWNTDLKECPLDRQFAILLNRHSDSFIEILDIVASGCMMDISQRHELNSALNDILLDDMQYWNQDMVTLQLSLFSGERQLQHFSFNDAKRFFDETESIFRRICCCFLNAFLWKHIYLWDESPDRKCCLLHHNLYEIFRIVFELLPVHIKRFDVNLFVNTLLQEWLDSPDVQKALKRVPGQNNGLYIVYNEIQRTVG